MIKKTLFFFSPILHYITTAMNCKVNKRTREREREPVELIKKKKKYVSANSEYVAHESM